jgi:hypothetical protein
VTIVTETENLPTLNLPAAGSATGCLQISVCDIFPGKKYEESQNTLGHKRLHRRPESGYSHSLILVMDIQTHFPELVVSFTEFPAAIYSLPPLFKRSTLSGKLPRLLLLFITRNAAKRTIPRPPIGAEKQFPGPQQQSASHSSFSLLLSQTMSTSWRS